MIIITGANGFVGQHLVPLALKYFKPSEILCLVSKTMEEKTLEEGGLEIIKSHGLKTLDVDLVTGHGLDKLPKSPSLVIHLAANTDTAKKDHRANDVGTENLLKALGKLTSKTHIIYTSTTVLHSGRIDCSKPITELTPYSPTNEYGRTKSKAEKFLIEQSIKQGFCLTVARLNTVYGGDPRTYKMFKVLEKNIKGKALTSRLNWPGRTAIIHVEDVSSALLMFTKIIPSPKNPSIYVLYAENLTLSEISKMMHERMGLEYKEIILPDFFWKVIALTRVFIPLTEKVFPLSIYNLGWRFGLIIDDVIWCETDKARKVLLEWKPRKFTKGIEDEISAS